LRTEAVGEIELEDKTLVIKRIVARYELVGIPEDTREEVERVHDFHARFCPVARSLAGGIDVSTELKFV